MKDKIEVYLNGRFGDNFLKDMDRYMQRNSFMKKFGDPIKDLNLVDVDCLWYPTWFTIKRLLFCWSTLLLWSSPIGLLSFRYWLFFFSFLYIQNGRIFKTRLTTRLELVNQAGPIFLIDVMLCFTDLINEGNPDDKNPGSVPDYETAMKAAS